MKKLRKLLVFGILFIMLSFSPKILSKGYKSIELKYSFEEPNIIENNGTCIVKMNGLRETGDAGKPIIPVKPLYILLPYGKDVDNINIKCSNKITIGYGYKIKIADYPKAISNNYSNIEKKSSYPYYDLVGVYSFRGFNILVMNIYPLHYVKENGKIYYFKNIDVKINLKNGKINPLFRGLKEDKEQVAKIVENPEMIGTYNTYKSNNFQEKHKFVIITSKNLAGYYGKYTFKTLIDFKNSYGMNATIEKVEDIINNPAYWNSTSLFNDTQAKIRNFIRYAYLNWGTDYILLGGDVDIIPVRMLTAEGEFHQEYQVPSDVYYACLDGNYNSDMDNKWGEPTDGNEGKDVDLMAEVYVGRASVDNSEEVKNFVMKTISYESNYSSYIKNVLLVGEDLGWGGDARWGGNHMDQLIDGCNDGNYTTVGIPSDRFNISKLYDRDWPTHSWPKSEIIKRMNKGVHIICHMGHSNYFYNMRLDTSDISQLTNNDYFFVYSSGCMAGGFDKDDCIAEYFTVKTPHGAFAGIWNTRYGWGGGQDAPYDIIDYGTQRYIREFWNAIFGENIHELGIANQNSKEANIWRINDLTMRFCFYELTLFGDPSAVLKDVDKNAPNKPSRPEGETNGKVGNEYNYTTSAIDLDGNYIYYKWDWGNEQSKWLGPYKSGEKVEMTHSWNKRGNYEIRVKAKDIYGRESDWSDPLAVTMPYIFEEKIGMLFKFLIHFLIPLINDLIH